MDNFKLSDQAMGAIMMALQEGELVVLNPPIVKAITREYLEKEVGTDA